ncbi:hypothetical protein QQ73_15120, partial [Candidatus Endoriftia persephone str. Guaymas]|nr:hypothetical protein [Candidatus Endoriftia persephone str. Guaymas]
MLEYIFFDERPWRRFIEFLDEQKLAPIISHGPEEWVVGLPEDLDDELDARIEAFYDEMLAYNEALV